MTVVEALNSITVSEVHDAAIMVALCVASLVVMGVMAAILGFVRRMMK